MWKVFSGDGRSSGRRRSRKQKRKQILYFSDAMIIN